MFIKKYYEDFLYLRDFYLSKKNPILVQKKILKRILDENKNTLYGRKYKFSKINNISEFQKKVPQVEYSDIKKYIEKIKDGHQNILTDDVVEFFATSSGTTSDAKFIPITKKRLEFFKREFMLWAKYKIEHDPKSLRGKMLYFAAADYLGKTKSGIPYGNITGYHVKHLSKITKTKMVLDSKIYNISDVDKRTKVIGVKSLIQKNITQISFAAPIEAVLFFDYIKENKDELIAEIEKKKLAKKSRIEYLKKIPKEKFIPIKIWPNLSFVNCIKADTMKVYQKTLFERIGRVLPSRDPGIYASEGRINLGIIKNYDNSGILVLNNNFFEFCEKSGSKYLDPITVDKIKLGGVYKILLTTFEGLYRYDVGDVVEVVGFEDKLPIVKFYDRDKYLNFVGENMSEIELIKSVEKSAEELKLKLRGFVCLPFIEPEKKLKYEFIVEFDDKENINLELKNNFLNQIENYLQKNVLTYKKARFEFGRVDFPILSIAKEGEFKRWEEDRMKKRSSQIKPIHIVKNHEFRDRFDIVEQINNI